MPQNKESPSDFELFVKLIGGPRDGSCFQVWGTYGEELELCGYYYAFNEAHTSVNVIHNQCIHKYRRSKVYVHCGKGKKFFIEYTHSSVRSLAK